MKKYITIVLLLLTFNTFGQRIATDYGDIYFEFFQFKEAAKYYKEALQNVKKPQQQQYLYEQLSQCYKYMFQYKKAEEYFELLMNSGEPIKPDFYIDYGNILKLNGKFEASKKQYRKYQEVTGTDLAEPFIRSVNWAIRNADTVKNYDVFPTDLDVSGQALGYCFYDDGLIYSHARNKPKLGKSETPLFDLDYAKKLSNTDFQADLKIMDFIQFDLNEGSPCVSPDGTILYFSANATSIKPGKKKSVGGIEVSEEGVSNFKIYAAPSDGGMFQNPVQLPFNDEEYSCIHPSITDDGNTLFFSSNMPGGFGGFDLYKSVRNETGVWSEPINMGKVVNSEENELFPWTSDDLFYFTSKGFNNYGGYDIFVAKLNKLMLPSNLKNIGQPINSFRDDVAFITKDGGRTGYFSSNRDNEEGADFVYYFLETSPKEFLQVALQGDSGILAKAVIGNLGGAQKVNEPGRVLGKDEPSDLTSPITPLIASKKSAGGISAGGTAPGVKAAGVKAAGGIAAGGIAAGGIATAAKGGSKTNKSTAAQPKLNQTPATKNNPVVITNSYSNKELLDKKFTPVQFSFNNASINESQMLAADSIIALMKTNSSVKVFIAAHADSRGSFEYNLKLTDRRAASVKRYFMNNGVPSSRIISRGFGESKLLNECADDYPCTEEQHAVNRRVELKLVN